MHGPGDVMYSMVTRANNTVFYIWKLLRALNVLITRELCVVLDAN